MNSIDQLTLATLAAACKGSSPTEKVAAALALLRESETALNPPVASEATEAEEIMEKQFGWIPLDHWLEGLMPKSKKPDRWAAYREFLRWKCEQHPAFMGPTFNFSGAGSLAILRALASPYVGTSILKFPQGLFTDKRDAEGNLKYAHLIESHLGFLRHHGVKRSANLREEINRFLCWKKNRDAEIRSTKAKKAALKRHRSKRAE